MRCSFNRHRSANVVIRFLDLLSAETKESKHVKVHIIQLLFRDLKHFLAEILTQCPLIEGKLDVKTSGQRFIDGFYLIFGKAFFH